MSEPGTVANAPSGPRVFEYVYLLHEREFLNSGRPLYKLGRTSQSPNDRFDDYPKGSCVVMYLRVADSKATEKALKAAFKAKYKPDRDIGLEYFEGDINEMMQTMYMVSMNLTSVLEENERLKQSLSESEKKINDLRENVSNLLSKFSSDLKEVLVVPESTKPKKKPANKGTEEGESTKGKKKQNETPTQDTNTNKIVVPKEGELSLTGLISNI
jgi:hypothetical protein